MDYKAAWEEMKLFLQEQESKEHFREGVEPNVALGRVQAYQDAFDFMQTKEEETTLDA